MGGGGNGHNTFEYGCTSGAGFGSWETGVDIQHDWPNYEWDLGHNMNGSNSEGLNVQGGSSVPTFEGSARVYCQVPELSEGFDSDNSNYEMQQNEEGGTEGVDLNGVKHAYREET